MTKVYVLIHDVTEGPPLAEAAEILRQMKVQSNQWHDNFCLGPPYSSLSAPTQTQPCPHPLTPFGSCPKSNPD